ITNFLKKGKNALAIEVIPPTWGDLTIGFVDWNPWPPDDNLGIWRPVHLKKTGSLALKNVFVKPDFEVTNPSKATVEILCEIQNLSTENKTGEITISFDNTSIVKKITIQGGQTQRITLSPDEFPALNINNPRLWWPNNMGNPELYQMKATLTVNADESDVFATQFGIRKIEDYFNEQGHRGYKINGKEILITGGGWVDDIFLDDPDEKVEDQIRYVKHMNLNTIRLEGFWGKNSKIYDYADQYGILVMIGWSCQWEWKDYCGREEDEYLAIKTEKEIKEHTNAYQDQVKWLRNHPSVFLWVYGSDKLLIPELEKSMNAMLAEEDGTRPILNSCGGRTSEVTGKSGVKMNGPYSYVTPNYWYEDDSRGGAFGFNTETGPGLQMAPMESIRKMIPQENLWPVDSIWAFHLGRREFASFENWMPAFEARYGMDDDVEKFAQKAQMASFEAMRGMFEAFHVNRPETTGIIQWMLNSAWPAMMWQLYDYYLMPNAAFYATKNACQPVNIAYNYKDKGVYITSQEKEWKEALKAEIKFLDLSGQVLFEKVIEIDSPNAFSKKIHSLADLEEVPPTYFLDLRLLNQKGNLVTDNFYWLSGKPDVLDFENSQWFVTGNTAYADFTAINGMPKATISILSATKVEGDTVRVEVDLNNTSDHLAFFNELSIIDKTTGLSILPVFWEDNYVSLLPGEKRTVKAYLLNDRGNVQPDNLTVKVLGWNLAE
ncbi:MAG: hypothetical protein KDC24_11970, partial [Saprospiraceae bacterium]|nr:hypothetical protein [Saprospiraceae bacterium]